VVVEPNPTHANLFGRLEHRVHFGTLVTDFTLIKPGALHQANGGYLVLEATDVLRALMAWDALKKALKSRSIRLEDPLDELRLVSTVSLAPEPIPLAVKVIYRRIREQLGPGEVEATERGTAAVFHALRDRLTPREADQVAAQLPALLKDVWTAGERVEREPTKLHRSEFLERIRQDAGLMTARQAEWLTVAVFSALKTQLSEGEAEDVVAQLPKDLKELWVEAP
jgi:uncharacterized protein (DUF2267 family)